MVVCERRWERRREIVKMVNGYFLEEFSVEYHNKVVCCIEIRICMYT